MYGWGIIKTLGIAFHHFIMTYVDDWKHKRSENTDSQRHHGFQGPQSKGIFTIQYPQEQRPMPERARILPFLVIDEETESLRCTACGICTQMCPVQCIWIERATDPETGRALKAPASYHVDMSLCMSCGFCAEFCPFDAIKMDQEYELSSYTRPGFVDMKAQAKPESYYAELHPTAYAQEIASKVAKAAPPIPTDVLKDLKE
jgi:NADH-quinone oxidoreductase subunit I